MVWEAPGQVGPQPEHHYDDGRKHWASNILSPRHTVPGAPGRGLGAWPLGGPWLPPAPRGQHPGAGWQLWVIGKAGADRRCVSADRGRPRPCLGLWRRWLGGWGAGDTSGPRPWGWQLPLLQDQTRASGPRAHGEGRLRGAASGQDPTGPGTEAGGKPAPHPRLSERPIHGPPTRGAPESSSARSGCALSPGTSEPMSPVATGMGSGGVWVRHLGP